MAEDGATDEDTELNQIQSQDSLQMQAVQVQTVKSTSVSEAHQTNNKTNENTNENEIEKKDTTLKDNEDKGAIDNENEEIDLAKLQEKVRKQSLHLREIGDQATLKELDHLEAQQKLHQLRYEAAQPPSTGSFLGDVLKQPTDSIIQITPTSSFLIRHDNITTILIDEFNADSTIKEYETIQVSLPRSPMAALILMESIGVWDDVDTWAKAGIYMAIFLTTIIQFVAAATLYFNKFFDDDNEYKYGTFMDGIFNLVVMSFVVIYLAQDCARLYKMYILLRHVTSNRKSKLKSENSNSKSQGGGGAKAKPKNKNDNPQPGRTVTEHDATKVKRKDIGFLYFFIFSNFLFYIFLLYYALLETLERPNLPDKLQVAIAVFFVLELDDWLYNVTIEPLKVLEDSVFELKIVGNKGSKKRRFRSISRSFWAVFFSVQVLIGLLYYTRTFEVISFR